MEAATFNGEPLESAYFWVTLNGLAVISADGELSFEGTQSNAVDMCLYEGCYFVGLDASSEFVEWIPTVDPITDDLAWTVSEPEPQFVNGSFSGYTFCVQSAWSDCTVEINTELGIGPNGAYLFEAVAAGRRVVYLVRQRPRHAIRRGPRMVRHARAHRGGFVVVDTPSGVWQRRHHAGRFAAGLHVGYGRWLTPAAVRSSRRTSRRACRSIGG